MNGSQIAQVGKSVIERLKHQRSFEHPGSLEYLALNAAILAFDLFVEDVGTVLSLEEEYDHYTIEDVA